jgi:hypothetical protein
VDVVADAPVALGVERAPQEQRRVAVAAARDGGVSRRRWTARRRALAS